MLGKEDDRLKASLITSAVQLSVEVGSDTLGRLMLNEPMDRNSPTLIPLTNPISSPFDEESSDNKFN